MLARGPTLEALQREGLQLQTGPENALQTQTHKVHACASAQEIGPQALVVLAVKAPAMRDAANQMAPLLKSDTVVLTAMNGVPWWFLQGFGGILEGRQLSTVDPGGEIANAIGSEHVVGSVVHASASVRAPGVVRHGMGNKLIVGEPSGLKGARVLALAALLQRGGWTPRYQSTYSATYGSSCGVT